MTKDIREGPDISASSTSVVTGDGNNGDSLGDGTARESVTHLERIDSRSPREGAIRKAATRLFRERGYHAASMRDLAKEVDMEAASLYNHFPSKQQLLTDILTEAMDGLLAAIRGAVETTEAEPVARMRSAVTAYVRFHEDRLEEGGISDSELRALHADNAQALLEMRRELNSLFRGIVNDGVASGVFKVEDADIATLAALSVCARLPVWYSAKGRLELEEIAEVLSCFVLKGLGTDS